MLDKGVFLFCSIRVLENVEIHVLLNVQSALPLSEYSLLSLYQESTGTVLHLLWSDTVCGPHTQLWSCFQRVLPQNSTETRIKKVNYELKEQLPSSKRNEGIKGFRLLSLGVTYSQSTTGSSCQGCLSVGGRLLFPVAVFPTPPYPQVVMQVFFLVEVQSFPMCHYLSCPAALEGRLFCPWPVYLVVVTQQLETHF